MTRVTDLYRYPVKGLSAEPLERVSLSAGFGFPKDRHYAFALSDTTFDPSAPKAIPKTFFLMLMKNEKLAALSTHFEDAGEKLTIRDRNGATLASGRLSDAEERAGLGTFFQTYLGDELSGAPHLVAAEGHQFTDVSVVSETLMRSISLINLASVRELEKALGKPVHPIRFRGNVYFDNGEPWSELEWVDRELTIGGVRLKGNLRTRRCPATQVNPDTAERDIDIPQEIKAHFGHSDMGVYAEVLTDGDIAVGDNVIPQS
ncbi:MAG: MOSC domain-containing protein [Pseudomonadota bacterium]